MNIATTARVTSPRGAGARLAAGCTPSRPRNGARERDELAIRPASYADHAALTAMLSQASPETIHARFRSAFGSTPPRRLVSRLLMTGAVGEAYLAFYRRELIGHAMWTQLGSQVAGSATAEISILVRDDYQRRGIGAELTATLLARVQAAGIAAVQVSTLAGNRVVTGMVQRRRPGARARREGTDVTFVLPVGDPRACPERRAPLPAPLEGAAP
jgi:GNAT superfamily N-acetyltransferase